MLTGRGATQHQGGMDAVQLKVAEKYLGRSRSGVLQGFAVLFYWGYSALLWGIQSSYMGDMELFLGGIHSSQKGRIGHAACSSR